MFEIVVTVLMGALKCLFVCLVGIVLLTPYVLALHGGTAWLWFYTPLGLLTLYAAGLES